MKNVNAGVSTSVKGCLERMAKTVDPVHAKNKTVGAYGTSICHGNVALAIKKRSNPDDLIWFYGANPAKAIMHSVLTNEDHEVVVDSYKPLGKFKATKGYVVGEETLDFLEVVPVSELYDDYMDYEIRAATDDVVKDATRRRKEVLQRQIETKRDQIDRMRKSLPSKQNKTTQSPTQQNQTRKQINTTENQVLDLKQQKSEASMYSFLLESKVLPESAYDFFTYKGKTPITLDFRGKPILIDKGMKFGVRPSTSGKQIRLIFPNDPTRVFTLDLATAKELADGVGKS